MKKGTNFIINNYFLLFWISLILFAVQLISLKTAHVIFWGGLKFILISLSVAGTGFGVFIFLFLKKVNIKREIYLFLNFSTLSFFLLFPYFFYMN
jgi:hypothetical protein